MDQFKNPKLTIRPVTQLTAQHWQLLLLADPSRKLVQDYLQKGTVWEARKDGQSVGIMVLDEIAPSRLEIKNIAVDPKFENQGIATALLHYALHFAKQRRYHRLQIGTGSTSFKQLYLYQKVGFRITGIRRDFFVKNYERPIYENGLWLQDMLVLEIDLAK